MVIHKNKATIYVAKSGKETHPVLMMSAWTLYSSAYTNEVTARGSAACMNMHIKNSG